MPVFELEKGETERVVRSTDKNEYIFRILKGSVSFGHREQYARDGLKRRTGTEGTLENIKTGYESDELWMYAHEKSVVKIEGQEFLSRIFNRGPSTKTYVVEEADKSVDEGTSIHNNDLFTADTYSDLTGRLFVNDTDNDVYKLASVTVNIVDTTDNTIIETPCELQIRDAGDLVSRWINQGKSSDHTFIPTPKPLIQPNEDVFLDFDISDSPDIEIRYSIDVIKDPSAEVNPSEPEIILSGV